MSYGQQPLTFINGILLCCLAGIYVADKIVFDLNYAGCVLIFLLLFSVGSVIKKSRYAFLFIAALLFVLGIYRYTMVNTVADDDIVNFIGQQRTVTGILQNEPLVHEDAQGIFHIRYEMKAVTSRNQKITGGYYINIRQNNYRKVQTGDRITVVGTIKKINSYKNPGRIDNVLQAKQQGVSAYISAEKSSLKIEERPNDKLFAKRINALRTSIRTAMEKVMPKTDAGAVFAMLFGGYADIDPELLDNFTTTGIVHILSVSGSHITLLAGSIVALGKALRLRQWLIFLILNVTIIMYAILSGLVPPVVRSASMGLLSYAALAYNKENQSCYLLSLVGMIMIIISPGLIFNISFQLSFAATAGLLYAAPYFRRILYFLPQVLTVPLSITISAQLFCLPFLAWYFHTVSLSSLIANVIAVPIIDVIIMMALTAVLANTLFPFISSLVFVLCSLLLGCVSEITRLLALLPASMVYVPYFSFIGSIFYYIIWLMILQKSCRIYCLTEIRRHQQFFCMLFCISVLILGWNMFRTQDLSVHFIDVGQGDAALIITPHGKSAMIDTGGIRDSDYDIGRQVDVPYLYHYGVTHLNYIFLSHAHDDHAGGVSGIVKRIPVDNIFVGREKRSEYASVWHISQQSDIMDKVISLDESESFDLDGVKFSVIYLGKGSGANETSAVIKVSYQNFTAMFTGDLPAQEEQEMIQKNDANKLKCTLLKVAHHGSKTSSTEAFLRKSAPRWAVISVGANNSYGHPAEDVLKRFETIGTKVYRTDKNGAIVFYTDGKKCRIEPYIE